MKPKIRHLCRHFELYSAARPRCRDVIPSKRLCSNGFRQPFNYHFGLWLLLSRIILSQTCSKIPKMIAVKTVKWIIAWKSTFFWPCERCSFSFFSLPPMSSRTEWFYRNSSWLRSTGQNGGHRSRFFFRVEGTSEAETSVSGKAECLLAIGEDKKVTRDLFGVINRGEDKNVSFVANTLGCTLELREFSPNKTSWYFCED